MFIKTAVIPILGAGAALAIIGLVAARRELPILARGMKAIKADSRGMKLEGARTTAHARRGAARPAAFGEGAELPHATVLPIAFWDAAAELDADDERRASFSGSEDAYDSVDADDLGADWLTRATQAPLGYELDEADDPAEIAADSMSMISEASRSAASRDWTDPDEDLDDDDRV